MSRKIYLASPFSFRFDLRKRVIPELEGWGHEIVSRWVQEPPENDELNKYLVNRRLRKVAACSESDDLLMGIAQANVSDLKAADTFIRFQGDPAHNSSGGKFVETGLALTLGLDVIVCGPRLCVFDYLPEVKVHTSMAKLKEHLSVYAGYYSCTP